MGVTCYHIVESRRSCNGLNKHIKMASDLSRDEIEDITDVFDLFDFWDGRDGDVDAAKTSDMMYCLGLNPTLEQCLEHGGTENSERRDTSSRSSSPSSPRSPRSLSPEPSPTSTRPSRPSTVRDRASCPPLRCTTC